MTIVIKDFWTLANSWALEAVSLIYFGLLLQKLENFLPIAVRLLDRDARRRLGLCQCEILKKGAALLWSSSLLLWSRFPS